MTSTENSPPTETFLSQLKSVFYDMIDSLSLYRITQNQKNKKKQKLNFFFLYAGHLYAVFTITATEISHPPY